MARLQRVMILSFSVIAPQNNGHYFATGCQVKSSITMRHCWSVNASEVAILSYTMAGWQHGSKHAEVWWQCILSVSCPHENINRRSDLLFTSALLFVTEITKNAFSLQITVLVKLRLCLLICSTERKTGLQQHHVKMCKCGICVEYGRFGSIPYIKSSIPCLSHSIFHTNFFLPFHTIVCPDGCCTFCFAL